MNVNNNIKDEGLIGGASDKFSSKNNNDNDDK